MRLVLLLLFLLLCLFVAEAQVGAGRRRMERRVKRLRAKYYCARGLYENDLDVVMANCPQDDARAKLQVIERMCADADKGWLNRTDMRLCDAAELTRLQADADAAEANDSG